MAGRRDISEIARFATTLTHPQRRRLGLPLKKGTRAFYQVPAYDVFYQLLTRMNPEAFATRLNDWFLSRAGTLPQALALDGKMIRNHIGLLTLAQHEDGAPHTVAVYDQKEGTERCEQSAAAALLEKLPALDGKILTADPLHCQRKTARTIVEKGGDYLLQIKGNQPKLLQQAQAWDALKDTPFLPKSNPATDALISVTSMPFPSNRSEPTSPSERRRKLYAAIRPQPSTLNQHFIAARPVAPDGFRENGGPHPGRLGFYLSIDIRDQNRQAEERKDFPG
jgi:hypothetical protein